MFHSVVVTYVDKITIKNYNSISSHLYGILINIDFYPGNFYFHPKIRGLLQLKIVFSHR